ncbi:cohesin complex subunit SA [Acrasis kona]|uniref:Cohesin complex subunit SA n=1 Tax=Acrasis kona TaxID=1008807 RepID=A0AAW2YYA9_9EUKA
MASSKSTGKRKRDEESDEERSSSDEQEQEQSQSSGSEQSDDERDEAYDPGKEKPKPKKSTATPKKRATAPKSTKKTPAKKTTTATPRKTKRTVLHTGKVKSKRAPSKTKKKSTKQVEEDVVVANEKPDSLFAFVREDSDINQRVTDLIEEFDSDPTGVVAKLITFVVHSSGCTPGELTADDVASTVYSHLNSNQITTYPIISNHASLKSFNANFKQFWELLINAAKDEVLFAEGFIDSIVTWITQLSQSQARSFRHTSTLCGYLLCISLIDVLKEFRGQLNTTEKQLQSAKNKKGKKSADDIAKKSEQLQERNIIIEDTIKSIHEGMFITRHKDISPNIRALTIEAWFDMVQLLPDQFLNNNIFKYFGWSLNDTDANIRSSTLRGLEKLYNNDDWHHTLQRFTERYLPRMKEMTNDIDISVSVDAIKLLTTLLRNNILTISTSHLPIVQHVSSLVFDANSSVRHYASLFVYYRLAKNAKGKKKKKKKVDIQLVDLLEFAKQPSKEMPMAASYIVEGFWEHSDSLKDVSEMTRLVLGHGDDSDDEDEEALQDDDDITNMIRILTACVQKATGHLQIKTTHQDVVKIASKRGNKKQSDAMISDMSAHLIGALPKMLDKYHTDKDKAQELITIAKYLDLEQITNHRLQEEFKDLLKWLQSTFWKHNDSLLFKCIGDVYRHLLDQKYDQITSTQSSFDHTARELSNKFQTNYKNLNAAHDENKNVNDHQINLEISLRRIQCFSIDHSLSAIKSQIMPLLSDMIQNRIKNDQNDDLITDALCELCINVTFRDLTWTLIECNQRIERIKKQESSEIDDSLQSQIDQFVKSRSTFCAQITSLISLLSTQEFKSSYSLCISAFQHLMELMVICRNSVYALQVKSDAQSQFEFSHQSLVPSLHVDDQQVKSLLDFFDKVLLHESNSSQDSNVDRINSIVSCLTKAMFYGELDQSSVTINVLSHFGSTNKVIGDVIQNFLRSVRSYLHNPQLLFDYEYKALIKCFDRHVQHNKDNHGGDEEYDQSSLDQFNELVNRMCRSHFPQKKDQEPLFVNLIEKCIAHAFEEPDERYMFLAGLHKYVNRMPEKRTKVIADHLEQRLEDAKGFQDLSEDFILQVENLRDSLLKKKKSKSSTNKTGGDEQDEIEEFEDEQQDVVDKDNEKSREKSQDEDVTQTDESQEKPSSPVASTTPMRSRKKRFRESTKNAQVDDDDSTQISQQSEASNEDEDLLEPSNKKRKL